MPAALYSALMLLLHKDGHSFPYMTKVKNVHSLTSKSAHYKVTVCKHKYNLTFTFLWLILKNNSSGFFIKFSRTEESIQHTKLPDLTFPSTYWVTPSNGNSVTVTATAILYNSCDYTFFSSFLQQCNVLEPKLFSLLWFENLKYWPQPVWVRCHMDSDTNRQDESANLCLTIMCIFLAQLV